MLFKVDIEKAYKVVDVLGVEYEVTATIQVTANGIMFLAIQQSKMMDPPPWIVSKFWGIFAFEYSYVNPMGLSGGLLCAQNPGFFKKLSTTSSQHWLVISGVIVGSGNLINIVNVHAPNELSGRGSLQGELMQPRVLRPEKWIFCGDFNEVRGPDERRNSAFFPSNTSYFNEFIQQADLYEFNIGGHQFTYISDRGDKMSKLERYLVCQKNFDQWPGTTVLAMARRLSDHCPLLLTISPTDFGNIPF